MVGREKEHFAILEASLVLFAAFSASLCLRKFLLNRRRKTGKVAFHPNLRQVGPCPVPLPKTSAALHNNSSSCKVNAMARRSGKNK